MRITTHAVRLGVFTSALALAACGGGGDAANETAGAPAGSTPPAAAPAGGAATPSSVALPAGVTQDMVAQGQQIFHGNGICFTCHGQNGTGSPLAPNQNDDEWLWITATDPAQKYEQIVGVINSGVPQPKEYPAPMPPKGGAQLSEDQVRQVAAYVFAISQGGGGQ